jgi:hypothetical protein
MWSAVELEDAPSLVVTGEDASRVPTTLLTHDGQGFLDDLSVLDPDAHGEAVDTRSGPPAEQPEVDLGQAPLDGPGEARMGSVVELDELGGGQGLAATDDVGIDGAQGRVGRSHGTSPCSETE